MKVRKTFVATVAALIAAASSADAMVIDFNLPSGQGYLGYSFSQDGFTVTNSDQSSGSYLNWVALGESQFNADDTADIAQNFQNTTNTITQDNGATFSFQSIALANVYNNLDGGSIEFTFNHSDGTSSSETVSLNPNSTGLQTFNFNQSDLTSVAFKATTTEGPWIQFDDLGVNGMAGVPEPATWAMLILGVALVGAASRRRAAAFA